LEEYLAARREKIETQDEFRGSDVLVVPRGLLADMMGGRTRWEDGWEGGVYFVATLDTDRCSGEALAPKVTYYAEPTYHDFSRVMPVAAGVTHLFFPVVECEGCRRWPFEGITLPARQRACLTELAAVAGYKSLPLPLWLNLPSDWREQDLFQRLRGSKGD
jgi:hypothetical protein